MKAPLLSAIAVFCLVLVLPASARQMYRYVNEQGNRVIAYQVPPDRIPFGYEILSEKGVLIEVVPRILSTEERAQRNEQQQQDEAARQEAAELQKWDESLLLRYSTVEDIEAARDRALRDLKIRVSILRGKQRSLKQQVENYQSLAADQERAGLAVSADYLNAIRDLKAEIGAGERAIADRELEIAEVEGAYEKDIARFTTLLELVQMRREIMTGNTR